MKIQSFTSIQQFNQNKLATIRELTNQGRHVEASELFKSSIAQSSPEKPSVLGATLQEMVQALKGLISKK